MHCPADSLARSTCVVLLAMLSIATPALADGFRVDNRVFVEKEEEPRIKSTTIFHEDTVYDCLDTPQEITVFDRSAGRIVLLDTVRKIRTEVTVAQLDDLATRLRKWASGQPDEFLRFSAEPKFDEQFDTSTGELRLASPWISYRVATAEPKRSEILTQYKEFCDSYSLLNTQINPGSRPPFPRILLNDVLQRLGRMPREVHLTLRPEGEKLLGDKITARSEHQVIPHLVESDRTRIAQIDQFMAIYQPLPFREYQSRVQPAR
jgi:hypothetical protein